MKKNIYTSFITNFILITSVLAIAYLIFNLFLFIILTAILLFISPTFYSYLNRNNFDLSIKLSVIEIVSCVIFAIIILGYNNIIIHTPRFQVIVAKQLSEENTSIQQFNIATYAIGIAVYLGIYYLSKRKFNKGGKS